MKKSLMSVLFFMILFLLPTVIFAADPTAAELLQEQVNNAEAGATITLTEDVVFTENFKIPEGKTITLDLSDKTLTLPAISNNYGMTIKGNLTITGNGKVVCQGIYGIGVSTTAGSSLTIKGGTYESNGDYLIGSWGTVIIEDGNFSGNYCIANGFNNDGYNGTVEIKGGTFNNVQDTLVLGNATVKAGTYNKDVKNYTPDGLTTSLTNGVYSIISKVANPEMETISGKKCFFANGAPITITEHADGALISWPNGSMVVTSDTSVFGGMHDDATPVNSSITMTSGTVKNIIGGGLHRSNTTTSTINVSGGTLTAIQGGGAAAFATGCDATVHPTCAASYSPSDEVKADATKSICQTGTATVNVSGNTVVTSTIYGGGQGISNTNKATVTISGNVDVSSGWVTAGGANGNTTQATLNIEGGNFKYVQSVNRGTMNESTVSVTGGDIEELYVAGIPTTTTGTINKVTLTVGEDATVTNLTEGSSGGTTPIDSAKTEVVVNANANITTISDAVKSDITNAYTVTINGTNYSVVENSAITSIPGYSNIISKAGHDFAGFINNGSMYDPNTPVTSNLTLTAAFAPITTSGATETPTLEKDDTPKTGVNDISAYAVILAAIALMGIIVIKKS